MADTSGPPDRRGEPEGGGAYVAQHLAVAREVLRRIAATLGGPLPPWRLAYQSRSGDGRVPWLEPDIGDVLRDVAGEGAAAVIVVPIGFISDHVEVSWDLNHEAAETAAGLGLRMIRVATPGTDEAFVRGLVDLVEERVRGTPPLAATPLGPWPGTCAVGCCPNPRRGLPAVAGVDAPF